jgi:hypothetical protein
MSLLLYSVLSFDPSAFSAQMLYEPLLKIFATVGVELILPKLSKQRSSLISSHLERIVRVCELSGWFGDLPFSGNNLYDKYSRVPLKLCLVMLR